MRIVHVVQSLGMGGQERLILDFSRELQRRGHEPIIATMSPGGALRPEFDPIPVIDIPKSDGFDPLAIGRIAKKLSELSPDVIHTHNPPPLLYVVPAARLLRQRRIVHTKHGRNIYGRNSLRLAQVNARLVSAFVAVSEVTREQALMIEHPPGERLHVIRNGIPLSKFGPDAATKVRVREELGIPPNAFVIGSVGRLAAEKDYPFLIASVRERLGKEVHLVLVGEGPERGTIESKIEPSLKPFVHLLGLRADVPDLLRAFDLFVLSSKTEGLPLVLPEAMASGLPILSTSVGGIPDVLRPEYGSLVAHGDAHSFSKELDAFLSDRDRTQEMGARAREEALRSYSVETMADKYLRLYGEDGPRLLSWRPQAR